MDCERLAVEGGMSENRHIQLTSAHKTKHQNSKELKRHWGRPPVRSMPVPDNALPVDHL